MMRCCSARLAAEAQPKSPSTGSPPQRQHGVFPRQSPVLGGGVNAYRDPRAAEAALDEWDAELDGGDREVGPRGDRVDAAHDHVDPVERGEAELLDPRVCVSQHRLGVCRLPSRS